MTKADIIDDIVEKTGMPKRDVVIAVEAFMETVKESMVKSKENIYLRGFGTFVVKHRKEKKARNIYKNTTMTVEAHDYPAFKPAKNFADKMKGGKK